MRIPGAVVLVTGSSRGIGAAIAARLVDRGARVLLHGRDVDQLDAVSASLGAKVLAADLAREHCAADLAEQAVDVYGYVDGVVHCAGVGWYGDAAAMGERTIEELIRVNVRAPIELTRYLLPGMLAHGHGHVCFIASIAGLTGVAHEAVYSATKAAEVTFADSLRLELAGTGVGVSVVAPGAVRTQFCATRGQPYRRRFPRPISADRVAAAVVRSMDQDRAQAVVPRWLALAPAIQALMPPAYRALAQRFG
jgi:short-subunit dehydrogenase